MQVWDYFLCAYLYIDLPPTLFFPTNHSENTAKGIECVPSLEYNSRVRVYQSQNLYQRSTTGSSNDSLQSHPFSTWELLLKDEFAPRGCEFFPFRVVPYGMEDHFYHIR